MSKFINYLKSVDLLGSEVTKKSRIVLTTVHKAKGLDYEKVVYIPSKSKDSTSFQDAVTQAILKSIFEDYEKGELEEEDLRLDFVAMTRARDELYIIAKKREEYFNEYSELMELDESIFLTEKELLQSNKKWLVGFRKNYFENLEYISFSSAEVDPYKYLTQKILRLSSFNEGLNTGLGVHQKIEQPSL